MKSNDPVDRLARHAARDYNPPPPTPREEMWAAIQRGRAARAGDGTLDLDARRARHRRLRGYGPWGLAVAVAATLIIGFGLGRVTVERGSTIGPAAGAAEGSASIRLAATEHLGEAEAMLTLFRTSTHDGDREVMARWARELLTTTRLLLDSRAAADPATAQLLGDLELVLVQIAHAGADAGETDLIEDGIEQRQLITKLRAVSGDPLGMSI